VAQKGDFIRVAFELSNTGSVDSDEVVQLYTGFPDSEVERPALALKGFRRVHVPSGESIMVTLELDVDELSYWDEPQQAWKLEPGRVSLMVGASSDDVRQKETVIIQ
jgi:beta-glucosidase